jgi:hypothetical protein
MMLNCTAGTVIRSDHIMLNRRQFIEITPIFRATLKNYVALVILPDLVICTPVENAGRATANDEENHSKVTGA